MKIQITYKPLKSSAGRLPPRGFSAVCNLQFCLGKEPFWTFGGSWALSECYSGGGGSKPQDESRSAPPDPRDDGFLQKIVDFLGGKMRFLRRENEREMGKAIRRDFAQIGNERMRNISEI